jgi:uncharacterized protein
LNNPFILIAIGIFVGIYSGIMGLGGGTIMIPVMVLMLGMSQHQAVGTSLAVMIPPVTLPAVIRYYRDGQVDFSIALWIALGVLLGTPLGQMVASRLTDKTLTLVFGFILTYVAGYTILQTLGKHHLTRSMILAAILVMVSVTFYLITRWYDAKYAAM